MTEGRAGLRLRILSLLVLAMFAALTTRLWYLQVLATERFKEEASENIVRVVERPAPRGRILDRNGTVLVGNRSSLEVLVNRQKLGDQADQVLYRLSKLLRMDVSDLLDPLEGLRYYAYQPVPVATDVSKAVAFWIAEHPDLYPGVTYEEVPVRTYPERTLAAHILGYVGGITDDQLKERRFKGYEQNDIVGQAGVEAVYERWLQGEKGLLKYRVNAAGENLGAIGPGMESLRGADLEVTIDLGAQRLAEESLEWGLLRSRGIYDDNSRRYLEADAGAVVVLDPGTGEIIAMATNPGFDPREWVEGFTKREYRRKFKLPRTGYPLLNRAIAGQYAAGSTFKPFVALSAFRRGLASTGVQYDCPATFVYSSEVEHRVFHNWTDSGLGLMYMDEALVRSCDTVFYPFGERYWEMYYRDPTREPFQQDLRAFGFGRPTGVDLPAEGAGRVPDAAWKEWANKNYPEFFPYRQWFPGDFIQMTIGQGDVLVTPVQLAAAYAAIQNGGDVCEPHVGLRVLRPDGKVKREFKPHCRKLPFSASQIEYVRRALAGVVEPGGTAGYAFAGFPFEQVSVAGKTGTAEKEGEQDFSWFAAMTSSGGEDYTIVAVVEHGGHGSTTAAPIVRRIIEGIYGLDSTGFRGGSEAD